MPACVLSGDLISSPLQDKNGCEWGTALYPAILTLAAAPGDWFALLTVSVEVAPRAVTAHSEGYSGDGITVTRALTKEWALGTLC